MPSIAYDYPQGFLGPLVLHARHSTRSVLVESFLYVFTAMCFVYGHVSQMLKAAAEYGPRTPVPHISSLLAASLGLFPP